MCPWPCLPSRLTEAKCCQSVFHGYVGGLPRQPASESAEWIRCLEHIHPLAPLCRAAMRFMQRHLNDARSTEPLLTVSGNHGIIRKVVLDA